MTDIRRNSTEILVVGPFVTSAGVAVTSMVLASASAAYAMLHDTSNAVDISGYTVATATCPGYFYLTLASAITSVVGPAVISVQNPTVHLPVEKNYRVMGSAPFDSLFGSAPTIMTSASILNLMSASFATYDPPTRSEAAGDRDLIRADVSANTVATSAIKAKTDIFVFDASTSANLNVNVKMFGGVTIVGSGSSGSLFRTAGT